MSRYIARIPPSNPAELLQFLTQELQNINRALNEKNEFLSLGMLYSPPPKPFDGMIVLADGSSWNPGSGGGFYGYRAGAWRFLG
jgi:hypothetical protein